MRTVKVRMLYGVGKHSAPWENHSLEKFIFMDPQLGMALVGLKIMPPLAVLNDAFSRASSDAGMGGGIEWRPFTIDEQEYQELVEFLFTNPDREIHFDKQFDHLESFDVWLKQILCTKISGVENGDLFLDLLK